jgi:flavodoxin
MKTLVVYFSRSGHTEHIAREIGERLNADLEEISETRQRAGILGSCRSALQVLFRQAAPIITARHDPADYDTVIMGTPVWIQQPAPPVRTYFRQHASSYKHVAFFCTEGGSGESKTFAELENLCGEAPHAALTMTERQLPKAGHATALDSFVAQIGS